MVRIAIQGPVGTIRIHLVIEARARLVAPEKRRITATSLIVAPRHFDLLSC